MKRKEYVRDKRSPIPKNESVSKIMSANKASNTRPELIFRKELFKNGLKGYRINYKKIQGRPDITFVSKKIAVFVHGCYWHRCPTCNLNTPKTNSIFWNNKFEKNIERDKRKKDELEAAGWKVIIIWECDIKKELNKQVDKIRRAYYE